MLPAMLRCRSFEGALTHVRREGVTCQSKPRGSIALQTQSVKALGVVDVTSRKESSHQQKGHSTRRTYGACGVPSVNSMVK